MSTAGENEIDGAIVVEIRSDDASARSVNAETRFGGDIRESAIAIVAPENVVGFCFRGRATRRHGDVEIEITIVIVVDEGYAHAARLAPDSYCLRDLFKLSIALVAQQMHAIVETNGEIGMAVVVEVAGGATQTLAF